MNKQGKGKVVWVVFFLIIIAGLGYAVYSYPSLFQVERDEIKFAFPNIGTIKCEVGYPNEQQTSYEAVTIEENPRWLDDFPGINIPNTDKIKVYGISPGTKWEIHGRWHWRICDLNHANCLPDDDEWYDIKDVGNKGQEMYLAEIDPTLQTIKLHYPDYVPFSETEVKIRIKYDRYCLKVYETTTGFGADCLLGYESTCTVGGGHLAKTKEGPSRTIPFTKGFNYLNYWDTVDYELNEKKLFTYNGKDAFCFGGTIYSKGIFETMSGIKYYYPESPPIAREDCCPGWVGAGYRCDDNFNWVELGEEDCITSWDCPGQGKWGRDFHEANQIYQAICVDGTCEYEYKDVDCSHDDECPEGQYCNKLSWTCEPETGPPPGVPRPPIAGLPGSLSNLIAEYGIFIFPILIWLLITTFVGAFYEWQLGWKAWVIGALVGILVAWAVYWFLSTWWIQVLAGAGILLWVIGGGLGAAILLLATKGRK